MQTAAAIIFKNQNAFSIARRFAEDVLNSDLASTEERSRAALLLAGIAIELGQPHSAKGMLRSIDEQQVEGDPELLASYLFQSACVAAALGDTEAATLGFQRSAALHIHNKDDARLARIKYQLAKIALETHDPEGARQLAFEALEIARRGSFAQTVGLALVALGRACALRDQFREARQWLLEAEGQAKRLGDALIQLEAQVYLLDLARRTEESALYKHARKRVDQALRSQRVPTALRKRINELVSKTEEGNA